MVSGSLFVKMYYFPSGHGPKILLTTVFFSPIMRGERPRAASAGKILETPGKASNPAVCGPPLGPQLPRPHVGLNQPQFIPGRSVFKPLLDKQHSALSIQPNGCCYLFVLLTGKP